MQLKFDEIYVGMKVKPISKSTGFTLHSNVVQDSDTYKEFLKCGYMTVTGRDFDRKEIKFNNKRTGQTLVFLPKDLISTGVNACQMTLLNL